MLLNVKMPAFRELSGKMVEEAFHCTDYESEHVVDTVIFFPPASPFNLQKSLSPCIQCKRPGIKFDMLLVKHGIEKNEAK